ncbi:hypothetical protein WO58_19470 [Salmonella enterica subsp. enterica serovar Agona]|nr:hypothetical protein [Salmonella enterica]EBK1907705.1 hypothetical protein [Salmonella enterica subsp. enterica serovar Agona]EBV7833919.1 hypothetical protein [Salmonella enterica subsp. enterica serovar Hadar]EDD5646172.1 hypothetical protein [Salmonella enterica subsp. enterica serovar Infantis]EDR9747271.1 hypothetical protein [Salmonella enterica subsp. enterica serovar 4,[5],12:i:-]EEK0385224.1 hypothetical protein [Salmonella enterica subsp. enterica serovar Typhimurium]EEY5846094.
MDKVHGFACVSLPHFLQTAPFPARPERVSATALKPPCKAGGRGGESTARTRVKHYSIEKCNIPLSLGVMVLG